MTPIPLTFRMVWVTSFSYNRISIKNPLLPFKFLQGTTLYHVEDLFQIPAGQMVIEG